jgi:hypothetical protein
MDSCSPRQSASYPIAQAADAVRAWGWMASTDRRGPAGMWSQPTPSRNCQECLHCQKQRVDRPLITTAISSADDPYAETLFRLAAELGAPYIKLGYWRYHGLWPHGAADAEVQRALDGIEKAGAPLYNVAAAVHNPSAIS